MVVHLTQMSPQNAAPDLLQTLSSPAESFASVMSNFSSKAEELTTDEKDMQIIDTGNAFEEEDLLDESAALLASIVAPEITTILTPEIQTETKTPVVFEDVNAVVMTDNLQAVNLPLGNAQDPIVDTLIASDSIPLTEDANAIPVLESVSIETAFVAEETNADFTNTISEGNSKGLETQAVATDIPVLVSDEQDAQIVEAKNSLFVGSSKDENDFDAVKLQADIRKPVNLDAAGEQENPEPQSLTKAELSAQAVAPTQDFAIEENRFPLDSSFESKQQISHTVIDQTIAVIKENLSNVSQFKNEISFILNPENLGQVAIKMVVEKGILTVELSAKSQETQQILASNLESIKAILKNISYDNQVNQIMQEIPKDYLQEQNEQANHKNEQQEKTEPEITVDDAELTENFLSLLSIFSAEEI